MTIEKMNVVLTAHQMIPVFFIGFGGKRFCTSGKGRTFLNGWIER